MFEVLVLAVAYYYVFLFLRGTRGAQVLVGLLIVIVALLGATYFLRLNELNWLLRKLSVYVAIGLLVIFQPEIRRALAELGKQPVFNVSQQTKSTIGTLVQAILFLADHKVGALIAIERDIGIRGIRETGVKIDSPVVQELLTTIFFPHTPLHDGGVVIKDSRIAAASCIFPLSQQTDLHKSLGTRHRAAIGLTEETDAVVLIVSEETGTISVSYKGRLIRGLDRREAPPLPRHPPQGTQGRQRVAPHAGAAGPDPGRHCQVGEHVREGGIQCKLSSSRHASTFSLRTACSNCSRSCLRS